MTVHQHDIFETELQGILDADGHRWFGKFKVLTKCGTLIDLGGRKRPRRPKLKEYRCFVCGDVFWRDSGKGEYSCCGKLCATKYANLTKTVQSYLDNPMDRCFNCHQWFRPGVKKKEKGGRSICCSPECASDFRAWANKISDPWRDADHSRVAFNNCIECNKLFAASNARKKLCSDECQSENKRRHKSARRRRLRLKGFDTRGKHRKRCHKYGKQYDPKVNLSALMKYYAAKCETCGCAVKRTVDYHPSQASIGHIVALSDVSKEGMKHGHHTWNNVMLQCVTCNSYQQTEAKGQASLLALMA